MRKRLFTLLLVSFLLTISSGEVFATNYFKLIEQPFKDGQSYSMIYQFSEGLAVVRKGEFLTGKWGFINEEGEEVIPCIYDFAFDFFEGLAQVKRGGKSGFINEKGEIVIPFIYNSVGSFSEGLASASNEQNIYGYIDKTGKLVIPHQYSDAGPFSEGLAHVTGDYFNTPYGRGHIDKTGKIITPFNHEGVGAFKEGLAFYRKDNKYGFINKNDDVVITAKYDSFAHVLDSGIVAVSFQGKWGVIDTNEKILLPFQYDYIGDYQDGLISIRKDGKWGVMNRDFNVIIPLKYDRVGGFSEGICIVEKKDEYGTLKWGYIDKTGKELTPFIYNTGTVVRNGVATVNDSALLKVVKDNTQLKETAIEKPKGKVATASKLKIIVDGNEISISSYLIDNNNYFKLRDISYALKSTPKHFNVYWEDFSKTIYLTSGLDFIPSGGEIAEIKDKNASAIASTPKLYINNRRENLECYMIEGSSYFNIRDLGKYLMFDVDYNEEKGQIEINTSQKLSVSIADTTITLGDNLNTVIQKLGSPDRIDDKVTNHIWYVYNNDYSKYIMVGFIQDKVAAIYTSHTDFIVNDMISYGAFDNKLPYSKNIDYYIDIYGGRILYGIMIKEDPSIQLWNSKADIKDIIPTYELQEFDCLNAFRVYKGLNPLRIDEIAQRSAREHSKDMADNNFFDHIALDGRSHYNRYWDNNGKHFPYAENLAAGDGNGFDQFKGLLNSSGHRSNMIIPDADYVGIGVYYNENAKYKFYGTQAFTKNK